MQSVNYALPLCGAGNLESVGVMAEETSLVRDRWVNGLEGCAVINVGKALRWLRAAGEGQEDCSERNLTLLTAYWLTD